MNITFRLARPADAAALSGVSREIWQHDIPEAVWAWKYFSNPFGLSALAVALEGGRIVGRMGAHAMPVHTPNGEHTAYLVGDNDILPAFRRGGTFFQLVGTLGAAAPAHGATPLQFGVALEAAKEVSTLALGFATLTPIMKCVRILDPTAHIRRRWGVGGGEALGALLRATWRRRAARALRHSPVARVDQFDSRFDRFWARQTKTALMIRKDAQYLNWRYAQCPSLRYATFVSGAGETPDGYLICHIAKRDGVRYTVIDELWCGTPSPNVAHQLLWQAIDMAARAGAHAILTWSTGDPLTDAAFGRHGFHHRPTECFWIARHGSAVAHPPPPVNSSNWCFSMGDGLGWIDP